MDHTLQVLSVLAYGFIFLLGTGVLVIAILFTTHNPRLQRGLDPADKAERVYHYAKTLLTEVGMIAHSCGVAEPRLLQRRHCRIVTEDGHSVPLDERYPPVAAAVFLP